MRLQKSCWQGTPPSCVCVCHTAVQDLFEGVLGADFMGEFAKPDAQAFHKVGYSLSAFAKQRNHSTTTYANFDDIHHVDRASRCGASLMRSDCP